MLLLRRTAPVHFLGEETQKNKQPHGARGDELQSLPQGMLMAAAVRSENPCPVKESPMSVEMVAMDTSQRRKFPAPPS